jgi:uncharacterized Zn finger protein (UPF0148 family)
VERYYYCFDGKNVQGPVESSVLKAHISQQRIPPTTLILKEGEAIWLPADTLPDIRSVPNHASDANDHQRFTTKSPHLPAPFKSALCPSCGGPLEISNHVGHVKCLYCGSDVLIEKAQSAAKEENVNFQSDAQASISAKINVNGIKEKLEQSSLDGRTYTTSEVSEEYNIPLSTAKAILNELVDAGILDRMGSSSFHNREYWQEQFARSLKEIEEIKNSAKTKEPSRDNKSGVGSAGARIYYYTLLIMGGFFVSWKILMFVHMNRSVWGWLWLLTVLLFGFIEIEEHFSEIGLWGYLTWAFKIPFRILWRLTICLIASTIVWLFLFLALNLLLYFVPSMGSTFHAQSWFLPHSSST